MLWRNGKNTLSKTNLRTSTLANRHTSNIVNTPGQLLNTKTRNKNPSKYSTFSNAVKHNKTPASLIFNKSKRGYPQISPCNTPRWQTCSRLVTNTTVQSNVNGRTFSLHFENDVSWKTNNLVYLITWTKKHCGVQYVGETGRFLSKRTQEHLYRFRRLKKYKSFVYQHLKKFKHNIKFIKVQP